MLSKSPLGSNVGQQQGAAMVVALLVVAMVVMVASAISKDFMLLLRQVENQLHSQQAYAYLLGVEGVARQTLLQDLRDDRSNGFVDHPAEGWLEVEQKFATDQGVLQGVLVDLQGRFNLNNLMSGSSTTPASYSVHAQRFIRLLQVLDLDEPLDQLTAEAITQSVQDWLDPDNNRRDQGAEDYYYGDAEPSGRAGNRPFGSVSQLRMVKGVSAEIYRALRPWVTVWPADGGDININTAGEYVLRSLGADKDLRPLELADVSVIMEERENVGGLADLNIFNQPPLTGKNIDEAALVIGSQYFLLESQTVYLERLFTLRSVLSRDKGNNAVNVLARSTGEL